MVGTYRGYGSHSVPSALFPSTATPLTSQLKPPVLCSAPLPASSQPAWRSPHAIKAS